MGGLFDFENKKIFFKDVHASFKFCALILGGEERRFDQAECAFFLHDTKTVHDEDRCFPLTPDDFVRVNPNTGTAPVFRTLDMTLAYMNALAAGDTEAVVAV